MEIYSYNKKLLEVKLEVTRGIECGERDGGDESGECGARGERDDGFGCGSNRVKLRLN